MGAALKGTKFEFVAKPYFWGVSQGCVCTNGKYAEAKREACKPEELKALCTDVPSFEPASWDSVNGRILCARREEELHLVPGRKKPKKDDKDQWTCPPG